MSAWGKHYGSMYDGSMIGKGAVVFALMGYVIAKMQCKWTGEGRAKMVTEGTVRLNLDILTTIFGEPAEKIQNGIDLLCSPDPKTHRPDADGRRLIKIGPFDYQVVNAAYYQNLRDKEEQREKTRERVAQWRENEKQKSAGVSDVNDSQKSSLTKPRFVPPTLDEVKLLMSKAGLPESEAIKFIDHHAARGWMLGRVKMKSVRHAVGTWKSNYERFRSTQDTGNRNSGNSRATTSEERNRFVAGAGNGQFERGLYKRGQLPESHPLYAQIAAEYAMAGKMARPGGDAGTSTVGQ